ncbi:phosphatases II [Gonapodya prolifera JEL478]|uniref:protein-tyrosine-phosphatase n=1 Tax=Gonapodya prolifera (strain JEL478) TaxID=1344416 RepID=A0A139AA62_GONPJ|nr:phosphatases II [Gonapodya prolifera JEL478]|eukprot:KXS13588.1 phosphatases II [Gonapodya prolifera JEL478]
MTSETTLASLRPRMAAYPPLARSFSPVNYKNQKFLILDCPTDSTLPHYATELLVRHVTDVVRVCEPTYNAAYLAERNIKVHEMFFKDGGVPPATVVTAWLHLVEERFGPFPVVKKDGRNGSSENLCVIDENGPTIAVHCVAGLGRAPVLVAIALIEAGMPALEAVEYIRKYRRGAFNSVQINYLDSYKRGQFKSGRTVLNMGKGLLGRSSPNPNSGSDEKKGRPPSPKANGSPSHENRTPSPGPDLPSGSNGAVAGLGVNGVLNSSGQSAPTSKSWLGGLFNKKKGPDGSGD